MALAYQFLFLSFKIFWHLREGDEQNNLTYLKQPNMLNLTSEILKKTIKNITAHYVYVVYHLAEIRRLKTVRLSRAGFSRDKNTLVAGGVDLEKKGQRDEGISCTCYLCGGNCGPIRRTHTQKKGGRGPVRSQKIRSKMTNKFIQKGSGLR